MLAPIAPASAIAGAWVILAAIMTAAWAVERRTGNSGWIDVLWTGGVGLAGVILALIPVTELTGLPARGAGVAAAVALWSLRLGSHLLGRTLTTPDDPRYRALVSAWGPRAPLRLFLFLQIQALAGIPLVVAILAASHRPQGAIDFQDVACAAVFVAALGGESYADWELKRFKARPENRGKIYTQGLWAIVRHPNYFLEWLCWIAVAGEAFDISGPYPLGLAGLFAPLEMYWLLVHASGIPHIERRHLATKGDEFQAYLRQTPRFFPNLRALRGLRKAARGEKRADG